MAVAIIWRNQEKLYKHQIQILKEKNRVAKEKIEFLMLQIENPSELRAELEIIKSSYDAKIERDRDLLSKEVYKKDLLIKKLAEKDISIQELEKRYEKILLFRFDETNHSLGQPLQMLRSIANTSIIEMLKHDKEKALLLIQEYHKAFNLIHEARTALATNYIKADSADVKSRTDD